MGVNENKVKQRFYFLEPTVLVAANAFQSDNTRAIDRKELLQYYLSITSQCEMAGSGMQAWLRQSYREMLKDIIAYRKAVQRDEDFVKCVLKQQYDFAAAMLLPENHPLRPENVGIFCSENPRDIKFALKTVRIFFKQSWKQCNVSQGILSQLCTVPDDIVQELRKFPNVDFNLTLELMKKRMEPNEENGLSGLEVSSHAILERSFFPERDYDEILNDLLDSTKKHKEFSYTILLMFLGDEARVWLTELLDMDTLADKDVMNWISNILPDPKHIPHLKLYRESMYENIETRFLKSYAEPDEMLHDFTSAVVLPLIQIMRESEAATKNSLKKQKELERKQAEAASALACANKAMQAVRNTELLEDQIQDQADEILRLQEQIKLLKKEIQISEKISKRLSRTVSEEGAEIHKTSDPATDTMSEDDEDTLSAGLKDRLGEELCQMLADKKVYVVGGHSNVHARLLDLFPHWNVACIDEKPSFGKKKSSYDVILLVTGYCSHTHHNAARKMARKSNIPIIFCNKNSAYGICRRVWKYYAS